MNEQDAYRDRGDCNEIMPMIMLIMRISTPALKQQQTAIKAVRMPWGAKHA